MRTKACIKGYLNSLEAVAVRHICSNDEQVLLSFPTRFGGLGIPLFHENAALKFENSKKLNSSLTD